MLINKISLPYRYPDDCEFNKEKMIEFNYSLGYGNFFPVGVTFNFKKPIFKYKIIEIHNDIFIERYVVSFEPWNSYSKSKILLYPIFNKIISNKIYSPVILNLAGIEKLFMVISSPNKHVFRNGNKYIKDINSLNRKIIYELIEDYDKEPLELILDMDSYRHEIIDNLSNENPKFTFNINLPNLTDTIITYWKAYLQGHLSKQSVYWPVEDAINPYSGNNHLFDRITRYSLEGCIEPKILTRQVAGSEGVIDISEIHISNIENVELLELKNIHFEELCDYIKTHPISDLKIIHILSLNKCITELEIYRYFIDAKQHNNYFKLSIYRYLKLIVEDLNIDNYIETITLIKTYNEEIFLIINNDKVYYQDLVISNLTTQSLMF